VAQPEQRKTISDVRALAALAHPVRVAMLNHLLAFGPRTASQCSAVVPASPSACSYHLRQLARWGFVEPVPGEDARERPWRATATGFAFGERTDDPELMAAQQALLAIQLDSDLQLAREFLRRVDDLEPAWRDAAEFGRYSLMVTPAELTELVTRLDAAIRPFIGLTRPDPPAGARPVHVTLNAFPEPGEPAGADR
jgi:DNA-binding transcriptional ArsR family regulator